MPLIENLSVAETPVQLVQLNLVDFVGGLCLLGDALQDNQSPRIENMQLTTDRWVCTRSPVKSVHSNSLPDCVCNAFMVQFSGQPACIYAALEDGSLWRVPCDGGFAAPVLGVPPSSNPECCWRGEMANGKLYLFNGVDAPFAVSPDGTVMQLDQIYNTSTTTLDGVEVSSYENPNEGSMPIFKYMVFHKGFMWGVSNEDNGCRIRFSFPVQDDTGPEDWNEEDWFTVGPDDGQCITGLMSCGDQLYVFKEHEMYVLDIEFGLSGVPVLPRPVPLLDKIGAPNCDAVFCCNGEVYFWDKKSGLLKYNTVDGVVDPFVKIRGGLMDELTYEQRCNTKVTVCNRRVYVMVPDHGTYVQQLDVIDSPWTFYCLDFKYMVDFCPEGTESKCVAFSPVDNRFVSVDDPDAEGDDVFGNVVRPVKFKYQTNILGQSASALADPFTVKEWCGLRLIGCGGKVTMDYLGDGSQSIGLGTQELDFTVESPDQFMLDSSVFPTPVMVIPGPGRDPVPHPCQEAAGDCLGTFDDPNAKIDCTILPDSKSCQLQICFSGTGEFCLKAMVVQVREQILEKTAFSQGEG